MDSRRGLNQLIIDIQSVREGSISKFLFIRVDRLTSSNSVFYALMGALKKKEVSPVALDEPFDINSIGGELTIDVRLAASKYEVNMLSMRVKKEREVRRTQKKAHWNTPLGYLNIDDKYVLNHVEFVCLIEEKKVFTYAELARFIFDVFLAKGSVNSTVAELHKIFGIENKTTIKSKDKKPNLITISDNLDHEFVKNLHNGHKVISYSSRGLGWTVSGLRNLLVNPVYAGATPYNVSKGKGKHSKHFSEWDVAWGTHGNTEEFECNEFGATGEAIITLQEFEQIREQIERNRHNRWATEQKFTNPFAHLLKCAICGSAYSRQSKKLVKRTGYIRHHYQCSKYRVKACHNKTMIGSDSLEKQVIDLLIKEARKLSELGLEDAPKNEAEHEEIRKLKDSLAALEKVPYHPSIETAKADIRQQLIDLDKSMSVQSTEYIIAKDRIISAFSDPLYWELLENEEKAEILKTCIRKILIDGNRVVRIEFKY